MLSSRRQLLSVKCTPLITIIISYVCNRVWRGLVLDWHGGLQEHGLLRLHQPPAHRDGLVHLPCDNTDTVCVVDVCAMLSYSYCACLYHVRLCLCHYCRDLDPSSAYVAVIYVITVHFLVPSRCRCVVLPPRLSINIAAIILLAHALSPGCSAATQ